MSSARTHWYKQLANWQTGKLDLNRYRMRVLIWVRSYGGAQKHEGAWGADEQARVALIGADLSYLRGTGEGEAGRERALGGCTVHAVCVP
jgi:hypothetical protein